MYVPCRLYWCVLYFSLCPVLQWLLATKSAEEEVEFIKYGDWVVLEHIT